MSPAVINSSAENGNTVMDIGTVYCVTVERIVPRDESGLERMWTHILPLCVYMCFIYIFCFKVYLESRLILLLALLHCKKQQLSLLKKKNFNGLCRGNLVKSSLYDSNFFGLIKHLYDTDVQYCRGFSDISKMKDTIITDWLEVQKNDWRILRMKGTFITRSRDPTGAFTCELLLTAVRRKLAKCIQIFWTGARWSTYQTPFPAQSDKPLILGDLSANIFRNCHRHAK